MKILPYVALMILTGLPSFSTYALTPEDVKVELASTLSEINELFGSKISVEFHEEAFSEGAGGFSAIGFESTEGQTGIVHAAIPNIENLLKKYPTTFTLNTVDFVAAHEAAHVLLGHVTTDFIKLAYPNQSPEKYPEVFKILGNRAEEDADTLAAKIMVELNKPIADTLSWNMALGEIRNYKQRNPMIQFSFDEGWKNWNLRNHMGPLCKNKIADFFEKKGANQELSQSLRLEFCRAR